MYIQVVLFALPLIVCSCFNNTCSSGSIVYASVMYTCHICRWCSLFWSWVCRSSAFCYVHWAGGVADLFWVLPWWSPCIERIGKCNGSRSIGTTSSIRLSKPRWQAEVEATIWPILYCIWTRNWWRFNTNKYTLLLSRWRGGKCSELYERHRQETQGLRHSITPRLN